MKHAATFIALLAIGTVGAGAGYWWGSRKAENGGQRTEESVATRTAKHGTSERKILYYRNPMGLPDTSPAPKKDPMGMDYLPVYEGEEPQAAGNAVKISTDRVQKLGVRTEAAALRELTRTLRAVGTVQANERLLATVAPKFEGWIQRLHVNTTGQFVARGQPLMEIYSPDLVAAQHEYLFAARGIDATRDGSGETQAAMQRLREAALQRLRYWDIAEADLAGILHNGKPQPTLTLRSPAAGVVLEKPAVQGMRFMPGEVLYRIADLSTLWLIAEVFEQDLALVRVGQPARIAVNAYPGRVFEGKVGFVYPTVNAQTRTARIRIELANAQGLLKPDMYASVELVAGQARQKVLAIPDSAVLDTGTRQVVLVQRGEGLFEPRDVKLGVRGDGHVEALAGIAAGDQVVVSANFLIDAESNLKAVLGSFGHSAHGAQSGDAAQPAVSATHRGEGTVQSVDVAAGSINVTHGPIASLKWPAMTMDFQVKDKALLKGVQPGQKVEFDLVEQAPGDYFIARIAPLAASAADTHKGH